MEAKTIADIMLACCGLCYTAAIIPQLIRMFRLKKASQFSWAFIGLTTFALSVSLGAFLLLRCYFSAGVNALQFIEYACLVVMKYVYDGRV